MIALPYSQENKQRKQDVFIGAVAKGCSITSAALTAGFDRGTAHNWLNNDKEFRKRFYGAQENQNDLVEDALFHKATKDKNLGAIVFWKCNRQPHLWKSVNRVEVTGPASGPIPISSDLSRLSVDDLRALEDLLIKAEKKEKAIETTAKDVTEEGRAE